MASNYYLLSSLPSLGDLGAPPPLSLAALRERVSMAAGAAALADTILLGDDLVQRDAVLSGETDEVSPVVLTPEQVRDEEPLPQSIATEESPATSRIASDVVWAAYYSHAAEVAQRRGSRFLAGWVAHEVALRNALATARAKALELDPQEYLVTPELGDSASDLSQIVSDWTAAPNPLEGLKVLDQARWQWLADHDAWFTFANDELAAYVAKLMLLVRWHRLGSTTVAPRA